MEHISPHIKTTVMRRIKFIWLFRRVLPRLAAESAAAASVLYIIAGQVFVNQVLQNAVLHTFDRSPIMLANFFFRAFIHTDILVQALVVTSLVAGALLVRDAARTLRQTFPTFFMLYN